jgi:hypothetical protein
MKRKFGRSSALFALAMVAAPLTVIATATPASAAVVQTCKVVKGTATFTPGLVNTPKDNVVKAKGTLSGCTPAAKTGGSGTLTATIKVVKGSCAKLATGKQTIKGTAKTVWKNKKTSTYALTLKTGSGATATTATITGKVTAGLFKGKIVTGAVKFTVTGTPNCTTKPVKGATFKQTKPFVIK